MRVQQQPGFVLHKRPYSESSLLVDIISRDHGRLTLIAKGARRLKSKFRGVLMAFSPLYIGWSGKGELPVVTGAEYQQRLSGLHGQGRWCGFYVNELLIRLLHRHDPHPQLYSDYQALIDRLDHDRDNQAVLRIFEKRLLKELGYALELKREANAGVAIKPDQTYQFVPDFGAVRKAEDEGSYVIHGSTLLALAREQLDSDRCLYESKSLMRGVMAHYLGAKPLHSRRLFRPFC